MAKRLADDHTGAGNRWRLAAFLLFGPRHCERTGVAHVVPGRLDPAVGALDMRDAELIGMAVAGISDAAHMAADAGTRAASPTARPSAYIHS